MCLANDGASLATIIVPDAATPVERTAAEELRVHLDHATGARFAVTNESAAPVGARIVVGNTAMLKVLLPDFDPKTLAEDGIVLKTVGDSLVLTGHPQRGPLYAVYTFLQDRAAASGIALTCYEENVTRWLDLDGVNEATRLMDDALAAAGSEEARDPVANRSLRDKVLREKLSLDHVWLINYRMFNEQAKRAGKPFLGPADPQSACRAWIDACARFGVKAYRETTTEETFRRYERHLLKTLGAQRTDGRKGGGT